MLLKMEKWSVAYGESLILRDVELEIGSGELVCLMGRNGVGKSTLLKSMMGLLKPRSGRIDFNGKDLTGTTPDKRARAGIGYVPQGREIFPQLTVLENLHVGMLQKGSRPGRVPDYIFDWFPALKDMLDRKGGFLSGGQQQQLAIARALVGDPKLIVLDEPTEGIQPNIITLIGNVLTELKSKGKMSVLLVEQYLEFATKLADRYYVMEKGSIVLTGGSADADKERIKPFLAF
jgi:urea transport system ATP-binding protein